MKSLKSSLLFFITSAIHAPIKPKIPDSLNTVKIGLDNELSKKKEKEGFDLPPLAPTEMYCGRNIELIITLPTDGTMNKIAVNKVP